VKLQAPPTTDADAGTAAMNKPRTPTATAAIICSTRFRRAAIVKRPTIIFFPLWLIANESHKVYEERVQERGHPAIHRENCASCVNSNSAHVLASF
jgi:hypothetical protein